MCESCLVKPWKMSTSEFPLEIVSPKDKLGVLPAEDLFPGSFECRRSSSTLSQPL